MKKALKAPYIGTRAELKRESIRSLKELVAYLNWYKGRAVICKNMIIKLLGIYKSWNYLTKQGLIDILTAWKNLANRWAKSRHYTEKQVGSEVHIMRGNSVYKRYLPAQKLWEARAIASKCEGLWTAIRKAKRCIGFKWEVEEWHPNSEQDLLSTVHKTFSSAGTFTKKECPNNPFTKSKPEIEKHIFKASEIKTPSEKANSAYDDIFGEPPTAETIEHNFSNKSIFVDSSIREVKEAEIETGWEILKLDTSMKNTDTSREFVNNKFEVVFKTGNLVKRSEPAAPRKRVGNSAYTGLADSFLDKPREEIYKISNTPGKGWFREHISGVVDTSRKFHQSLMKLIIAETSYVPF